jgi:hypothetical protein
VTPAPTDTQKQAPRTLGELFADCKTPADRLARIRSLPRKQQERILLAMRERMPESERLQLDALLRRAAEVWAPETDDELWAFVSEKCGMKVPRRAVCAGHCAPFDLMADVYFERGNRNKLAIGNRGSGKTRIMGTLHAVSARTKDSYQSATAGATLAQSNRCYGYFRKIMEVPEWLKLTRRRRVNQGGTEFRNGAFVEVVTGTMTGVNSPHPHLAHLDEVELLREGVYEEALNMAQSSDGWRAQNVLTSSWKLVRGLVTRLVEQVEEAERAGREPPYEVYRWCAFETAAPCPDDCSMCPYADVQKGKFPDGRPRTFDQICKNHSPQPGVGRLKFSDGFVPVGDLVARFAALPARTWDAQQESRRPTAEGLVYWMFDEMLNTTASWDPDPELGPWYLTVDFGGTVPHAVGFWQGPLQHEVQHDGKRIPAGAYVLFDEVYELGGNVEVAQRVVEKLESWRALYPDAFGKWRPKAPECFGDPAAKAARADWARLKALEVSEYDVPVTATGAASVEEGIALVQGLMEDGLVYVDRVRCEHWFDEQGAYELDPVTGKPKKENDHFMDSMRYGFWNLHVRRRSTAGQGNVVPMAIDRARAVHRRIGQREQGFDWDPGDGRLPQPGGHRKLPVRRVSGARVIGPVASIERYRGDPGG